VEFVVKLLAAYLEPRLFTPAVDPFNCGRVSRIQLEGRRELTFTGNRVLLAATGGPSRVACLLDGRPPSQWPGLYQHGRASAWPRTWLPALLKIESAEVPVEEDWTLTVDEIRGDRAFTFHLRGSVTGHDGNGRADADFTSVSGRVVICSADWYWEAFQGGLTPGFQVRWPTRFHGSDHAEAGGAWRWIEVANGLEDGPHTLRLELLAGWQEDFPEALVYHPSGPEAGAGPDRTMRWIAGGRDADPLARLAGLDAGGFVRSESLAAVARRASPVWTTANRTGDRSRLRVLHLVASGRTLS
jgi:hypothetical protein